METKDLLLAAISTSNGEFFSPVQIQKFFFLLDKEIPGAIGGKHFEFEPYNFGPFDRNVYVELNKLAEEGLVAIHPMKTRVSYGLTSAGQDKGEEAIETLSDEAIAYINKVSEFVRSLSFSQLVRSIYKSFPEMKENSVFID